jgi:hypothetical protein
VKMSIDSTRLECFIVIATHKSGAVRNVGTRSGRHRLDALDRVPLSGVCTANARLTEATANGPAATNWLPYSADHFAREAIRSVRRIRLRRRRAPSRKFPRDEALRCDVADCHCDDQQGPYQLRRAGHGDIEPAASGTDEQPEPQTGKDLHDRRKQCQ